MTRQTLLVHILFVLGLIHLSISKSVNHATNQSVLPQTPFSHLFVHVSVPCVYVFGFGMVALNFRYFLNLDGWLDLCCVFPPISVRAQSDVAARQMWLKIFYSSVPWWQEGTSHRNMNIHSTHAWQTAITFFHLGDNTLRQPLLIGGCDHWKVTLGIKVKEYDGMYNHNPWTNILRTLFKGLYNYTVQSTLSVVICIAIYQCASCLFLSKFNDTFLPASGTYIFWCSVSRKWGMLIIWK